MRDHADPTLLEWVAPLPDRIVRLERRGPDRLGFEDVELDAAEFDAAMREAPTGPMGTIELPYAGWKVTSLRMFDPLVYYCAFGDADVIACLELSLRSLLGPGRYRRDVAVITSAADAPRVEALRDRLGLGTRLRIVLVEQHADIVDFCLARFRVDDPVFGHRQPLVYMDCDVIVDAPVEPFLLRLAGSDRIHVAREGQLDEGHPESAGHWYGWRMMAQDGMAFSPRQPGFSAGFIAAGRADLWRRYARMILETAAAYQAECGERRPFLGFDQCVANYVLLKTGIRSFELTGPSVLLFRIDPEAPLALPPHAGRGFVHVLNAEAAGKRAAMARYLDAIQASAGGAGPA